MERGLYANRLNGNIVCVYDINKNVVKFYDPSEGFEKGRKESFKTPFYNNYKLL